VSAVVRNNVTLGGSVAGRPMVFAHGCGSDQNVWRFATTLRTVLVDHVGADHSETAASDFGEYASAPAGTVAAVQDFLVEVAAPT
jgi:hypothetical protein